MAAPKRLEINSELHRRKILLKAANMFLSQGYTQTTLRELARESGVNIGSLMHLFENKENILCALVSVVLDGQFSAVQELLSNMTDDKILFWASETTLQLYMAESSEQIRDLYITAYSLPKTSDIIRRSIAEKMSEYFLPYNPGYQEKDFYEMEIATGGIIRGFMSVPCDMYFTMDAKVARYLETSFRVYKVPQEKTQEAIQFVSRFDFAQIAQNVIDSLLSMLAEEI
ncbi:MAG: TetR/AcrR family transcriptional regulator [Clostridia bacterium]|nr:TetR/AcrR family transcriptional regulator [Clostridia bacterium]